MAHSSQEKIDPVCGMNLAELHSLPSLTYNEMKFVFCSDFCKGRFERAPKQFQGEPLLALRNVWKIFRSGDVETKVLRGLYLNIWEGDFVAVIGASGSGKSTALNLIGLLDRPTRGDIYLRGENAATLSDDTRAELRSKTFGFVFQQYNLIPWFTAYENVALPLIFAGKSFTKEAIYSQFREIGIGERHAHFPSELSGGEQQRTALLRALANDPLVIVGDEPTGNLDSATGGKVLDFLLHLNKERRKTLVVVTHDADIAEKADQVITIKDGQTIRDHHVYKKVYTE